MTTTPDANGDGADRSSNVLVLAPSVGADGDAVCEESLHSPDTGHALVVACAAPAAERLDALADRGQCPARTTVLDVAIPSRAGATVATGGGDVAPADATPGDPGSDDPSAVAVERIDADLPALGEAIHSHLTADPGPTTLCVHSVTDLLGTADREAVFRFLAVLTSAVDRAGVRAHYHLQPDVHDPETVAVMETPFDEVVDLRPTESTDR